MEEDFSVYYCSVCHTCKKCPEYQGSMKFCTGCKLVQYCSTSHQKQDWPTHRELCKSVQHITTRANTEHIYQEASGFVGQDVISWNDLRKSVLKLVELVLKRSLTAVESQILLFPPVCNYCHLYKAKKMFPCDVCKSVMYCCNEHQTVDKKHSSICVFLLQSFETDILRLVKSNSYDFSFLNGKCHPNKLPENMEVFLQTFRGTLSSEYILLSEPLSYSLTLVFVINKIAKTNLNKLTLHIVGADTMEGLALQTFPIMFDLLPHLTHLSIVMVGPNMFNDVPLPPLFEEKCSVDFVSNTYHQYLTSPAYTCPHIIAVFNCGFCEFANSPEKDTWKHSLPCILNVRNCMIAITSYTEKESEGDLQRLCEIKRMDSEYSVLLRCQENPFCSIYPHRDWENDGIFYINKYISVLKT